MLVKKLKIAGVLGLILAAGTAQGGVRPEALQLKGYDSTAEGDRTAIYAVHCSNRTEPEISSVEGVRKWCSEGTCFRDKIAAARAACDNSLKERLAQSK